MMGRTAEACLQMASPMLSRYVMAERETEFRGSHGMEEGKGERYLASGRQYGNALLGVRHQEEEEEREIDSI